MTRKSLLLSGMAAGILFAVALAVGLWWRPWQGREPFRPPMSALFKPFVPPQGQDTFTSISDEEMTDIRQRVGIQQFDEKAWRGFDVVPAP